jgi:phage gpG-like protein
MDFTQFNKALQKKSEEVKKAIEKDILLKIESAGLRFVDDNFRNQGYEGEKWKESDGTILVKSGALRRGFESDVGTDQVRFTNDVKYAPVHNEGFDGEVSVPEHFRNSFKKKGAKKTKTGKVKVKAYKKHMKIPKRQYAPTIDKQSPTLNKQVEQVISSSISNILNK